MAGFLDGLLGTKTNGATTAATKQVAANNLDTVLNNSSLLNSQFGQANDALRTGASTATSAINNFFGQAAGTVGDYGGRALDFLNTGSRDAAGLATSSNANYSPYLTAGQGSTSLLADALGVNGADGNGRALDAFQAGPGYQRTVDSATDNAMRRAAAMGMTSSGNTVDAVANIGADAANSSWQQWLTNLSGLGQQGLSAANSVSGNNNTAAGIQSGAATTGAGLLNSTGSTLGQIFSNQGTGLGNIATNLGTSLSGNDTSLGSLLAQNNWIGTKSTNDATLANGKAQDAADSANNGIFKDALGTALALATGNPAAAGGTTSVAKSTLKL